MRSVVTVFIAMILCVGSSNLFAQQDTMPTSQGKDFWFCYLPNFHNDGMDSPTVRTRDSIYVFVVSKKPTTVTLTFTNEANQTRTITRNITDPTKVLTIGMSFYGYELRGLNTGGNIDFDGNQTGTIGAQSFHLTSTEIVSVYALNQARTTSDAFLVLPTEALSTDYMVMSYYADPVGNDNQTPSQFAVVAMHDSTVVNFSLTAPAYRNRAPKTVVLDSGEVFLLQSDISSNRYDFTGSRIRSNKPIAVFSGHQRVTLPFEGRESSVNTNEYLVSRDCLIEQVPPVRTWGRNALITPYPQPPNLSPLYKDKFRVLAAFDSTKIYIDSVYLTMLQSGQFYEGDLDKAMYLQSSRPTLVAQFKKTSNLRENGNSNIGDPFMMLIPPSEQFLKNYRCINAQSYDVRENEIRPSIVYEQQYITILTPTVSIPSVLLDSLPIPAAQFKPIGNSTYSFTTQLVRDGVHTVEADSNTGILVFGYGEANSYGYIGGMNFIRYDFNAPTLTSTLNCYKVEGTAYDTALADSQIEFTRVVPDSSENVNVVLPEIGLPVDSVRFSATLIDDTKDGYFVAEFRDVIGFITRKRFDIPGFTVKAVQGVDTILPVSQRFRVTTGTTKCTTVTLVNYGLFPQTITEAQFSGANPALTLQSTLPIVLQPKQSTTLQICFAPTTDGAFQDTLFLNKVCGLKTAVVVNAASGADRLPPQLTINAKPCATEFEVFAIDSGDFESGIQLFELVPALSYNVELSTQGKSESITGLVKVINPRLDAQYSVHVRDTIGHDTTYTQAIPGFTVSFVGIDSLQPVKQLASTVGYTVCDTVELYNYSQLYSKNYDDIYTQGNIRFSIPPTYRPITLAPGERKRFPVCYQWNQLPEPGTAFADTIRIWHNCLSLPLYLNVTLRQQDYNSTTECNVPIIGVTQYAQAATLLQVFPNPTFGSATARIAIPQTTTATLWLDDVLGNATQLANGNFSKGIYDVQVPLNGFQPGRYSMRLQTETDVVLFTLVLVP